MKAGDEGQTLLWQQHAVQGQQSLQLQRHCNYMQSGDLLKQRAALYWCHFDRSFTSALRWHYFIVVFLSMTQKTQYGVKCDFTSQDNCSMYYKYNMYYGKNKQKKQTASEYNTPIYFSFIFFNE